MDKEYLQLKERIDKIAHESFDDAIHLEQSPDVPDELSFAANRIAQNMNGLMVAAERLAIWAAYSAQSGEPPCHVCDSTMKRCWYCASCGASTRPEPAVESGELTGERERKAETWPQHCDLCNVDMESADDRTMWHGLGNCVEICTRCEGSGQEPKSPGSAPQLAPLQPRCPNWPIIPGRSVNASYRAGFSEAYRLCVKAYEESLAAAPPRGEGSTPAGYGLTEFVQSVQSAAPPRETEGRQRDEELTCAQCGGSLEKCCVGGGMLAEGEAVCSNECYDKFTSLDKTEPAEGQPGKVDVEACAKEIILYHVPFVDLHPDKYAQAVSDISTILRKYLSSPAQSGGGKAEVINDFLKNATCSCGGWSCPRCLVAIEELKALGCAQ